MIKAKTTKLQDMVARAGKGVGNDKFNPITNFLMLDVMNGVLTITSTDATNYLSVSGKVEGDDFHVVIFADQFSKLIARMTCEDVSLTLKEKSLEIVGNGTYNIALPEENGEPIKLIVPTKEDVTDRGEKIGNLSIATIKAILNSVKPGLSDKVEQPLYTNYFVGNGVVATNGVKINTLEVNLFEHPILISSNTMELLDVITDDSVDVYKKEKDIWFVSDNYLICSILAYDAASYPISKLTEFINSESYTSTCKVSKLDVVQALDRIGLFVSELDDDKIVLSFDESSLTITSKLSDGVEKIEYISSENPISYVGESYLAMLKAQIRAQIGDTIEICYGGKKSLKMVNDNVTAILALAVK